MNLWIDLPAARKRFPKAYIHLYGNASFYIIRGMANNTSEDFGLQNARRIINRYQEQIPCFNDDIQGTGVTLLPCWLPFKSATN